MKRQRRPDQQQRQQRQPLSLLLLPFFLSLFTFAAAFAPPLPPSMTRSRRPAVRGLALRSSSNRYDEVEGSFKGFGLLEWANNVLPQKVIVKSARYSWNLIWKVRTEYTYMYVCMYVVNAL